MARKVIERKSLGGVANISNLIDSISRGEYVLIIGSEIVMDKNVDEASDGDSTRFLLDSVVETKREEGRSLNKAENFSDFILRNSLDPRYVRQWLLEEIGNMDFKSDEVTPDLRKLLESRCFRMVLTTTLDPYVEQIMKDVWGEGKYRVMNIYNHPSDSFDLTDADLKGDEYYGLMPTLYYAFGKADPDHPDSRFVLDDNDTMDCISRWLSESAPKHLLDYLAGKKLLLLGCKLQDWCFRFFWYAMRHKDSNSLDKGDIAVTLNTNVSETDRYLYGYLHETVKIRIETDSRKFIREIAADLDERKRAGDALLNSAYGGVFLSYASEDFSLAWTLCSRLREQGVNVWLDNRKLTGGADYEKRITQAIKQCGVFMPLLSDVIAADLVAGTERYYRKEWAIAESVADTHRVIPVAVAGYDYRNKYHSSTTPSIIASTVFDWTTTPISVLVKNVIDAVAESRK